MTRFRSRLAICALLLAAGPALAQDVQLPALFSDHMVVQRYEPIRVWGTAAPGAYLPVRLGNATAETDADAEGRFRVDLPAMEAGGPYTLEVGNEKVYDVLVGEVWVASGQSNMEWSLSNTRDGRQDIAAARDPLLRLFTVERSVATSPREDVQSEGWRVTDPESVARFSAVAYYFGRMLRDSLDVPVGLIHTSWGGTVAEAWTSYEGLQAMPDFAEPAAQVRSMRNVRALTESLQREAIEERRAWARQAEADDAGYQQGWQRPEVVDAGWATMQVPGRWEDQGLPGYDGVVWFRKTVELDEGWADQAAVLHLGFVDGLDSTYVNGVKIGTNADTPGERHLDVPVGLLQPGRNVIAVRIADRNGSSGFRSDDAEDVRLEAADGSVAVLGGEWRYRPTLDFASYPRMPGLPGPHNQPTALYNAMIAPLTPMRIRGAIWYQGESNAGRAYQYRTLFPLMIQDWRRSWGDPELPFFFVQLANFMERVPEPVQTSDWPELREAQREALRLPLTGMAVAIDIGEADDIHPRNKEDVGIRLALPALRMVYGLDVAYSGPTYEGLRVEEGALRVLFGHADGGLYAPGGELRGFAVAGSDGRFHAADARIEGPTVVVSSPEVPSPVAVRYGWADNPEVNLYNGAGLPASPFRSDAEADWVTAGR